MPGKDHDVKVNLERTQLLPLRLREEIDKDPSQIDVTKKFTSEQLKVACMPVACGVQQNDNHFFSYVLNNDRWFEISNETVDEVGTHAQMLQRLKEPINKTDKPYFVIMHPLFMTTYYLVS